MPDTRPYKLTKADLKKFSSSLGDVLGYIKYSKDKKALSKFLNDSQVMIMDNDAARVIRDITNLLMNLYVCTVRLFFVKIAYVS